MREELVNRFAEHGGFVGAPAGTFEVNKQRQRGVTRKVASPLDHERLGMWVQVALPKRRGIDRVEELSQFGHADFDNGGRGATRSPADGRANKIVLLAGRLW